MKNQNKIRNIAYIALGAALITACTWISIPLPMVAFTMQTFAVPCVAGLLGWKRGTLAITVYIALGMMGLPVFSGFKGGIGVLAGMTGGYIVGFLFTALIVGIAADRWSCKISALIVGMGLGSVVCYAFGTAWFMVVYAQRIGAIGLMSVLGMCVFPFLLPEVVKISLAILVTRRLRKYVR